MRMRAEFIQVWYLNSHVSNFLAAPLLLSLSCLNANIPKETFSKLELLQILLQYTYVVQSGYLLHRCSDNGCSQLVW